MTSGARGRPGWDDRYGLPAGDTLAARLFPPLPGRVLWGLDRVRRILGRVGDPHRAYPVLLVGGTNGKGSVARVWAAALAAGGLRVGLHTSPHLVSFRERVLVDARPLPDGELEAAAAELEPAFVSEAPSLFEATTALGFLAMARAGVEVAVVEVGLGGRLDATNVTTPVLSAITNISMDHEEYLGNTLPDIAREKGGILKAGVPAFTSVDDPESLGELERIAREVGAPLVHVPAPSGAFDLRGGTLCLATERWGTLELTSPLVGRHQLRNVALAVRALEALPPRLELPARAIVNGVATARLPGRFQVEWEGDRCWIFDVAHNPEGVAALAATLEAAAPPRPRVGVVGILADKDAGAMLGALAGVLDRVILTVPDSAPPIRRWDPERALGFLPAGKGIAEADFGSALARAREVAGEAGSVVVCGSFYTVGDALIETGRIPPEALPPSADSG